jgi:protein TonB
MKMKRFLFTNSRILTIFGIVFLLLGLVLALMFLSEEPQVEKEGPPAVKIPDIVRRAAAPPKPPLPPPLVKKRKPRRDIKRPTSPVEIPDEIEEGDTADFGIDDGVEGGVEGGVAGGVMGGILKLAVSAKGNDPYGYRSEFIKLVEPCQLLQETR